MTNGDKIRAMSDEALAVWVYKQVEYTECAACPANLFCLADDAPTDCPTIIYRWIISQEKAEEEEK